MLITIGSKVLYKREPGEIVWVYNNRQCEFLEYSTNVVSLVSIDDLTIISKP